MSSKLAPSKAPKVAKNNVKPKEKREDSGEESIDVLKDMMKPSKMPTKIVIRRLPPTMTEKEFVESVSPLPEHDYFVFSQADTTLVRSGGLSKVVLNFVNEQDVFGFKERFDGYVFVDKDGHEFPAIVEFAPNQRIPKTSRQKKDSRQGTIDEDKDYVKFVEIVENPVKATKTIEQYMDELEAREKELKSTYFRVYIFVSFFF